MTALLEQAVARARELPEEDQQRIGAILLVEVEQALRDAAFDALIESRPDVLAALMDEAKRDEELGLAVPLVVDDL
ncbi:MAG: hypothetical protein ACKVVT_19495 [Dehalococcoidia bacterium]